MSVETTRGGTPKSATVNISTLIALLGMFASAAIAWGDLRSELTSHEARMDVLDVGGTSRLNQHQEAALGLHRSAVNEARAERDALRDRIETLEKCVRRPDRCPL